MLIYQVFPQFKALHIEHLTIHTSQLLQSQVSSWMIECEINLSQPIICFYFWAENYWILDRNLIRQNSWQILNIWTFWYMDMGIAFILQHMTMPYLLFQLMCSFSFVFCWVLICSQIAKFRQQIPCFNFTVPIFKRPSKARGCTTNTNTFTN